MPGGYSETGLKVNALKSQQVGMARGNRWLLPWLPVNNLIVKGFRQR